MNGKPFNINSLAAYITALLLPLTELHAADAPRQSRPMLLAVYYCWYHSSEHPRQPWSHWNSPKSDTNAVAQKARREGEPTIASAARPLAGFYDSADPGVAKWHVQLAQAAGVDAFLVDWWDTFREGDKSVDRGIVAAAEAATRRPRGPQC
jgi:hypothetical protein